MWRDRGLDRLPDAAQRAACVIAADRTEPDGTAHRATKFTDQVVGNAVVAVTGIWGLAERFAEPECGYVH